MCTRSGWWDWEGWMVRQGVDPTFGFGMFEEPLDILTISCEPSSCPTKTTWIWNTKHKHTLNRERFHNKILDPFLQFTRFYWRRMLGIGYQQGEVVYVFLWDFSRVPQNADSTKYQAKTWRTCVWQFDTWCVTCVSPLRMYYAGPWLVSSVTL